MPLVRFGLLGDIHQEDRLLESALTLFEQRGAEAVLAVGDVCDGWGSLERTCARLQQVSAMVVRGNHERWLLAGSMRDLPDALPVNALGASERAYLAALPPTLELDTALGKALLCHGLGDDDMAGVRPDDRGYALEHNTALNEIITAGRHRLVLNGHTHAPMVRRFGELTIVNAGTLHRDFAPCAVLVDCAVGVARFFDIADPEPRERRALAL